MNGDGRPDIAVALEHEHVTGAPSQAHAGLNSTSTESDSVQVVFGGALPATIDLTTANVPGFTIAGTKGESDLGASLAAAGDVNGDGLADLAIGAPGSDPADVGGAYVVYGKRSEAPIDLSQLGDAGFSMVGSSPGVQAGVMVAGGGDVNGDGHPDLLIGSQWRSAKLLEQLEAAAHSTGFGGLFFPIPHSERSVVDVVFGGSRTGTVDLGSLGADGFEIGDSWKLEAVSRDWLANAGDVNGDGRADILIGTRTGAVVIFGRTSTSPVDPDTAGAGQLVLRGPARRSTPVSRPVAGIGDLNRDDLADFVIGVPGAQWQPEPAAAKVPSAYVVFGRRSASPVDLTKLGSGGFAIEGAQGDAGTAVEALGDLNHDGRLDFGVMARTTAYGGRRGHGSLYVIFGGSGGPVMLEQLGRGGVRIDGDAGHSIGGVGGAADTTGSRIEVLTWSGASVELARFAPVPEPERLQLLAAPKLKPRWAEGFGVGFGSLWVLAHSDTHPVPSQAHRHGELLRIDRTGKLVGRPIPVGSTPRAVTAAAGSLWVLDVPHARDRPAMLFRIDPKTSRIVGRTPIGGAGRAVDQTISSETITYGEGSLWITYGATGSVYRVDPQDGKVIAAIKVGLYPQALAIAGGSVWVADRADGAVREIDPARNHVVGDPIPIVESPDSLASLGDLLSLGSYAGRVWVYDPGRGDVVFIDPRTRRLTIGPSLSMSGELAIADGPTLWLAGSSTVGRVRLRDGRSIGEPLQVDAEPVAGAAYAGSFWTTDLSSQIIRVSE